MSDLTEFLSGVANGFTPLYAIGAGSLLAFLGLPWLYVRRAVLSRTARRIVWALILGAALGPAFMPVHGSGFTVPAGFMMVLGLGSLGFDPMEWFGAVASFLLSSGLAWGIMLGLAAVRGAPGRPTPPAMSGGAGKAPRQRG